MQQKLQILLLVILCVCLRGYSQFRSENFMLKFALGGSSFAPADAPADSGLYLRTRNVFSGYRNGGYFNMGFEYYINKRFGVDGTVIFTGGQKTSMRLNIVSVMYSGKYFIRPNNKVWSPYVKVHLGYGQVSVVKDAISDTLAGRRFLNNALSDAEFRERKEINVNSFMLGFGLGLDIRLTKRLTLFAEYNYNYGIGSNDDKIRNTFRLHNADAYYNSLSAGLKFRLFKPNPDDYLNLIYDIKDIDTDLPIGAGLSVKDTSDSIEETRYADNNGKIKQLLSAGSKYTVKVTLAGYSTEKIEYNLKEFTGKKDERRTILLYKNARYGVQIKDSATSKNIAAQLKVYKNQQIDTTIKVQSTDTLGRFYVVVPFNERYAFVAYRPGTKKDSVTIESPRLPEKRDFSLSLRLNSKFVKYQFDAFDAQSGAALNADITLTNLTMDEEAIRPKIGRDGKYEVMLREGHQYKAVASGPKGYAYEYANFEVPVSDKMTKADQAAIQKLRFNIISLKTGNTLLLREILFKYNSNEVNDDSYEELNRVARLMKDNPSMRIEIGAHTDNIGSQSTNQRLSEKRAGFIVNYMVQQGVSPKRMVAKGYGKSKPVAANDTDENRAKNRRLELVVLSNE